MKTRTTFAIAGPLAAAAAFLAVNAAYSDQPDIPQTPPTPPAAETRLTPVTGVEEYKILSLAAVQNERDTRRMEELLNKLAAEGWKVRTGVGVALVLSR
jgi:hypothetical protein